MKKNLQILILSVFILFISINLVSASENIGDINNNLDSSNTALSENLNSQNTNLNDIDNSADSEPSYNDSIDDNSYNNYAKNQNLLRNGNISSDVLNSYDNGVYVGKNITVNGTGTKDDPFNNLKLALDKVSSNKTVYVYGGIYTGEKNTGLSITGDTSIIKYGGGDVVFKGSNSIIFNVTGSNCVFKGLFL